MCFCANTCELYGIISLLCICLTEPIKPGGSVLLILSKFKRSPGFLCLSSLSSRSRIGCSSSLRRLNRRGLLVSITR